jgi:hypothetical protein
MNFEGAGIGGALFIFAPVFVIAIWHGIVSYRAACARREARRRARLLRKVSSL